MHTPKHTHTHARVHAHAYAHAPVHAYELNSDLLIFSSGAEPTQKNHSSLTCKRRRVHNRINNTKEEEEGEADNSDTDFSDHESDKAAAPSTNRSSATTQAHSPALAHTHAPALTHAHAQAPTQRAAELSQKPARVKVTAPRTVPGMHALAQVDAFRQLEDRLANAEKLIQVCTLASVFVFTCELALVHSFVAPAVSFDITHILNKSRNIFTPTKYTHVCFFFSVYIFEKIFLLS